MVKYSKAEDIFDALGQRTRRKMVEVLAKCGSKNAGELAGASGISLPGTIKHLQILEESGIISCKKEGRALVCEIDQNGFDPALDWLRTHHIFWQQNLDRLSKHVNRNK